MNKFMFITMLLMFSIASGVSEATVNASLTVNNGGSNYILSVGDYFSVPQKEVVNVSQRKIPDEEVPVVFYLAQQAKVEPSAIINHRLNGLSWSKITNQYGLGPEIFYVPVNVATVSGPPYGHAYGYYKNKPRKDWKKMKLGDDDIVNLVNLKFMSEHYKYPADRIMKMRGDKKNFYAISDDIENQKKANEKNRKAKSASSDKGKGEKEHSQKKSGDKNEHSKGDKEHGNKSGKSQKGGKHGGK